jgi:hypothetical protein
MLPSAAAACSAVGAEVAGSAWAAAGAASGPSARAAAVSAIMLVLKRKAPIARGKAFAIGLVRRLLVTAKTLSPLEGRRSNLQYFRSCRKVIHRRLKE